MTTQHIVLIMVGAFFLGCLLGCLIIVLIKVLPKLIISPKIGRIMGIERFKKMHTFIANVPGKRINKPGKKFHDGFKPWALIDISEGCQNGNVKTEYTRSLSEILNLYILIPFIEKLHWYPITLVREILKGKEKEDDTVIYQTEDNPTILVERIEQTNHIRYRADYPMVFPSLSMKDLSGTIKVRGTPTLEAENPMDMLTHIDNYLRVVKKSFLSIIRGEVAVRTPEQVNQIQTGEAKDDFNVKIQKVNEDGKDPDDLSKIIHMGLKSYGVKCINFIFEDFDAEDEATNKLFDAFTNVKVADEERKVTETNATATANAITTIAEAKQNELKKTGRMDANGKLVPDSNVAAMADAIKHTKIKVFAPGAGNSMINLNSEEGGKDE